MLDLSDGQGRPARWTILLGENGTGKTTALQLLEIFDLAFKPFAEMFTTQHAEGTTNYLPSNALIVEGITLSEWTPGSILNQGTRWSELNK